MEYRYYIQGVHPMRLGIENDILLECKRYDFYKDEFVSDFLKMYRIEEDLDCKKVSEKAFWEYVFIWKVRYCLN